MDTSLGKKELLQYSSNNNNSQFTQQNVQPSNSNIYPSGSSLSQDQLTIFRLGHSDIFGCHNCKKTGDKWYMQTHNCSGKK